MAQPTIPLVWVHAPRVVVTETKFTPEGRVLVNTIPEAEIGPLFVLTDLKVTLLPRSGGLGTAVVLTPRSVEHSPPPSEQTFGKNLRDQHCSATVSNGNLSMQCKRHTPLTRVPDLPLKFARGCCGRHAPTNGGDPLWIGRLESSSKVVRLVSGAQLMP